MGEWRNLFGIVVVSATALYCKPQQVQVAPAPRLAVTFGERTDETPPPSEVSREPEEAPAADPDLPDPEPSVTDRYLEYVLLFQEGEVSVGRVTRGELQHPAPTPRRMGRFAFELFVGKQLLDRVRFDFPLLGASVDDERDAFEGGLHAQTVVRVPWLPRATVVRILDRKTRQITPISWPPSEEARQDPASPDASKPDPEGEGAAPPDASPPKDPTP